MDDLERIGGYLLKGESTLMWIAIGIGALFIAILAYDLYQRKRHDNRFRDRRGGLFSSLKRPFRKAAELRTALKELRRQRAERRKWEEPARRQRRRRRA